MLEKSNYSNTVLQYYSDIERHIIVVGDVTITIIALLINTLLEYGDTGRFDSLTHRQ